MTQAGSSARRIAFIHGAGSSSQGFKGVFLRNRFPELLAPDLGDDVAERIRVLEKVLMPAEDWVLIGSSLGGLTAAIFAARHPGAVRRLVLLAPALLLPDFDPYRQSVIDTPTVLIHGRRDEVVPLEPVRQLAEGTFRCLRFIEVDDDHRLHRAMASLDWQALLS